MISTHCSCPAFQNPWHGPMRVYMDRLRVNDAARAREGLDEAAMSKIRTEYDRNKADGGKTFDIADHTLNTEARNKKEFLSTALKRFQTKTGIDETKYLQQIEEALNLGELKELERKFKKAGIMYYRQQIEKSGLFVAMDPRERQFVDDEKKMYFDWIETQPLDTEDPDEPSIIEALGDLKDHLEERRKGRHYLKSQTSYVQNEYFRMLGSMATDGSKEKLLQKVLKSIGNLEKEPSAVQAEFKKASKKTEEAKTTEELLGEIRAEYSKKTTEYNQILEQNAAYFGGKEVAGPRGKMREARKEFEDWFGDLHSFAKMESMKERLMKNVIPERKAIYKERDEMLAILPEEKQKLIRQKTDEMRLHTLKAYLKETTPENIRGSIHAMEYMAHLETAEYDGYPLFNPSEKLELKKIIQSSSVELQEAELKVLLGRMIPEREETIKNYLALEDHLKEDHLFFSVNIYEKRKLLRSAEAQRDRELTNPFDIDNLPLDPEEKKNTLLTKLHSETGKQALQQARKELTQEGKTQRTETQMKVMGVMSGQWNQMKVEGTTQAENYMQQIYKGARVNNRNLWKAAWENGEAKDDNQKFMAETARTDYRAYLAGRGRTWGGNKVEIGKVSAKEFERGDASMLNKLGTALYPENMLFLNAQGEDELRPDEMGREVLGDSLKEDLKILLEEQLGIKLDGLPRNFKEAVLRLAIIGEHGGIFNRINRGDTDIIDEAVN